MDNLLKIGAGAGEQHAIAGADWTWKVRNAQAGGDFCVFEMVIEPGQGVPLHLHSYPETFYVLDGELQFQSGVAGSNQLLCRRGDTVLARPEVPHAFFNDGATTARILSIASAAHEAFFDSIVAADRDIPFSSMPLSQAFARVVEIGALNDTRFVSDAAGGR